MLTPRLQVLIVDDSATMRKIIRHQLQEIGIRAVEDAANGQIAIDKMKTWTPDLVLSDFDMTPVNGKELLSHIRGSQRLARVPLVMVTAHIVRFSDSGRDGGITHFLAKPFKAADLRERIIAVLQARQLKAA